MPRAAAPGGLVLVDNACFYRHFRLDPVDCDTNILIEDGRAWLIAESSIRVFERLGFRWSLMTAGRVLPWPVRDWLWGIVARNRRRWFGSRAACYRPVGVGPVPGMKALTVPIVGGGSQERGHKPIGPIVRYHGCLESRQALPKIGCLTLSPGLMPSSAALPPLISSTPRTG